MECFVDESNETTQPNPTVETPKRSGITHCDPRVQLATERTLLAWIRTGLALMAFGFVVARFALVLQSLGVETTSRAVFASTVLGCLMVLLGVLANAGASLHYRKYFDRLGREGKSPFTAWSLAVWVALATAFIGIILIIYLFVVDLGGITLNDLASKRQ